MNEEGNASLIEIVIAAMILIGAMALVSTMEPTFSTLQPATDENGYLESVGDAYEILGYDPRPLITDLWGDSTPNTQPSLNQIDQFDSLFGTGYSIYLNTGVDRVLLYGPDQTGDTMRVPFVAQASIPVAAPDQVFEPGAALYGEQGFFDFLPIPLGDASVDSVVYVDANAADAFGPFSTDAEGNPWKEHWGDAMALRAVPTELPYGRWIVTVSIPNLLPFLPPQISEYNWMILHDNNADPDKIHNAVYAMEVVLP